MKPILIFCMILISLCGVSCRKTQSIKTDFAQNESYETDDTEHHVYIAPFVNNINIDDDYTDDARARVIAGLKSNPTNASVRFTNHITSDCRAIVYGVITSHHRTKIDAQDVVVSYRLSVHVINPADNKEVDAFIEFSDKSIENAARILNVLPAEKEILKELSGETDGTADDYAESTDEGDEAE